VGQRTWLRAAGFDDGVVGLEQRKEEEGLTGGAHMSTKEERECATAGMDKPEEKAPFGECAKASRADWAGRGRRRPGESWANAVKLGQIQRKIQNRNWFSTFK
jgi:hypothetical protein